jgi:hypothetical protein
LDRCLPWNEHHLRRALREYAHFYNRHQAHQALEQAAPLRAVPTSTVDPNGSSASTYADETGLAVSFTSIYLPLELHG